MGMRSRTLRGLTHTHAPRRSSHHRSRRPSASLVAFAASRCPRAGGPCTARRALRLAAQLRPGGGHRAGADARARRARRRRPRARRARVRRAQRSRRDRPRRARGELGRPARDARSRTDVLEAITYLGQPGVDRGARGGPRRSSRRPARAVAGSRRSCSSSSAGNGILTTTIKHLADRVRPDAQPGRGDARAVVPERALVVVGGVLRGRGAAARARPRPPRAHRARRRWPRALAVAIAAQPRAARTSTGSATCVAGLALGWAWFAACAIAFGGRLLRFGAAVRPDAPPHAPAPPARGGGRPRPPGRRA